MKAIAKVWTFKSSSSDKTYQTLLYSDFTTSCDCPGWTRRCASDGSRTCRHTRFVDLGRADAEAIDCHGYAKTGAMLHTGEVVSTKDQHYLPYGHRKLCV